MFGLQLHLKSQSETINRSCRCSQGVCSLDIVEIGTWHHRTTLVSLVKFLHTDAAVCGAAAIHLYPLHAKSYHISCNRSPAESGNLLENLQTHTYSLCCVTYCMIEQGLEMDSFNSQTCLTHC
jgi:hypothetical protein